MAVRPLPPLPFLRECFSYDPDTGAFQWRVRPLHHFDRPSVGITWNRKMAGAPAFTQVDPDGYLKAEVQFEGSRYRLRANRVAHKMLTGEDPELVDHKNGAKADDRGANLRAASAAENARNRVGRTMRHLPKGVSLEKGRFRANGHLNGRKINLGAFRTPSEAHAAFCAFASAQHGAFFNPGPVKPSVFD